MFHTRMVAAAKSSLAKPLLIDAHGRENNLTHDFSRGREDICSSIRRHDGGVGASIQGESGDLAFPAASATPWVASPIATGAEFADNFTK
jgi:hypothetical protein